MAGMSQMPFFMQGPPQAPPPHSHLVCGGCQTLLMYPQGAANVRCSRCQHITPAPPTAGAETAQLVCNGCRVLLSYPRGAQSVQCSMCHTVTQVPAYGHLVCSCCNIMLMFPIGAQSVKCSVCHSVTPVPASQTQAMGGGRGGGGPSGLAPGPLHNRPNNTVVVENPPSLDEQGNPVQNIAVGVKSGDGN
ncbi:zinc-finger protein Lsd1 [Haematococcus lacustris]